MRTDSYYSKSKHWFARFTLSIFLLNLVCGNGVAADSPSDGLANAPIASEAKEPTRYSPGAAENALIDAEYLAELAKLYLPEINRQLENMVPMADLKYEEWRSRKIAYLVAQSSSFVKTLSNQIFLNHPDVLYFRIGYEIASWAAVAPLAVSGHPGLIAALHFPAIGTISTGAYFITKTWIEKRHLKKQYGVDPDKVDDLHMRLVTEEAVKSIRLHVLNDENMTHFFAVGKRTVLKATSGEYSPDFIAVNELEDLIDNPDFLNKARNLSLEPSLYEELLIQKVLSTPELKTRLIARVKSLKPLNFDSWGLWVTETEAFLNRARVEATLQELKAIKILKAAIDFKTLKNSANLAESVDDRIEHFKKVYAEAHAQRSILRKQIIDADAAQKKVIAAILKGEKPDEVSVKEDFHRQRASVLVGFEMYKNYYSEYAVVCEDYFK